jgi:uncharacterized protein
MGVEVGRGLEGAVTGPAANRILEEYRRPYLRNADFCGGVRAGIDRALPHCRRETGRKVG